MPKSFCYTEKYCCIIFKYEYPRIIIVSTNSFLFSSSSTVDLLTVMQFSHRKTYKKTITAYRGSNSFGTCLWLTAFVNHLRWPAAIYGSGRCCFLIRILGKLKLTNFSIFGDKNNKCSNFIKL